MEVKVILNVPRFIFNIYDEAAKKLEGYSIEQVMAGALGAYATYLFEEMVDKGEISLDKASRK